MEDIRTAEKTLDKRDLRRFIERLASSGVLDSVHAPSRHSYSTLYTLTLFFDSDARIVRWNSGNEDLDESFIWIAKRLLLYRPIETRELDEMTGIEVKGMSYYPGPADEWSASVDFETGACHVLRRHGFHPMYSGEMDLSLDRDNLTMIMDALAASGVLGDKDPFMTACDGTWYTMNVLSKTGTRIIKWNCGDDEVERSLIKLLNTMLISRLPLSSLKDSLMEDRDDFMRDYPELLKSRDD